MNILITGGCGFIGTNTALYFAKRGHNVIVLDNLSRRGSEKNLRILKHKGASFFRENIIDDNASVIITDMLKVYNIDAIFHFAAQVAVTDSVREPIKDFEINARGTLNVLEAARLAKKKPIVLFTSTNKVYGALDSFNMVDKDSRYVFDPLAHLKLASYGISENQTLDFHSPYGCSKGCADQYVRDYYRIYGLPTIVFRMSCIYGPYQYGIVDQGWVSFLTMLAMFGKQITIYGNGKQVRDILFVEDLCHAFELAIKEINITAGQIYNIGGGLENSISVLELLQKLQEILDERIEPRFSCWRPGDQKIYISDIRKAFRDFGWEPEIKFNEGFHSMLKWIKKNKIYLQDMV